MKLCISLFAHSGHPHIIFIGLWEHINMHAALIVHTEAHFAPI